MIYVIFILAIAAGVTFLLMKSGKVKDENNNNIPDALENKVAEAKELVVKVKKAAKKVTKKPAKKKATK